MTETAMSVEIATTRDGTKQLRRRWTVTEPKVAMLIIHGIAEHSGRYIHVGDFFAEMGYDVATFDNRGFGESGGRRGHVDDFDHYLDDIEAGLAARAELGVPTVLLGHSLGGLMAARYLVDDRPQPELGVLSAPALSAVVPLWQRLAAPVLGRVAPKLFVPSKIDGAGLSRDPDVQEAYTNDPLLVAGGTAGLGHQIFEAMKATSEQLDRLRVPTYVLHGDADPVVPPEASSGFRGLDTVTYRSWPGLRHECLNEPEQDQVMGEIAAWIDQRLAGGR